VDIREMSTSIALRKIASLLFQLANNIEKVVEEPSDGLLLKRRNQCRSELYVLERDKPLFASIAEDDYEARRMRDAHLKCDLFGEPAWDILLDLYVQQSLGRQVNVTSSCIASNVPHTTALRYLSALEKRGFVERSASEADKRITYFSLTQMGLRRMGRYLQEKALR